MTWVSMPRARSQRASLVESDEGSAQVIWMRHGVLHRLDCAATVATASSALPHSIFSGEVEALNTPTIRRLIPSRRHQLSPIALAARIEYAIRLAIVYSHCYVGTSRCLL